MKKMLFSIIIMGFALIGVGVVLAHWVALNDTVRVVLSAISIGGGVAFVVNAFDLWRYL